MHAIQAIFKTNEMDFFLKSESSLERFRGNMPLLLKKDY